MLLIIFFLNGVRERASCNSSSLFCIMLLQACNSLMQNCMILVQACNSSMQNCMRLV